MKQCLAALCFLFVGSLYAADFQPCPAVISTDRSTLAKTSTPIPKGSVAEAVCKIAVGGSGGSGTNIDPRGRVLTCAHVVGTSTLQDVELMFPGQQQIIGRVIAANKEADLALVEFDNSKLKIRHIPLAENRPEPGDEVFAMGYPSNGQQQVFESRKGTLSELLSGQTVRGGPSHYWLRTSETCWIKSGDSGGALVNADSQLVGVPAYNDARHNDYRCQAIDLADIYELCGILGRFKRPDCPTCPKGGCQPQPDPVQPPQPMPNGPAGKDGAPGAAGKDGLPGKDGRDGKDADPANMEALKIRLAIVEARLAALEKSLEANGVLKFRVK